MKIHGNTYLFFIILMVIIFITGNTSCTTTKDGDRQDIKTSRLAEVPFKRGVNLTNWLQASNVRQIQFTKFTKQDLIDIKTLGCDVIRLPLNLLYMTGGSPHYTIDPLFFHFLDQIVDWAEELKIHLILDNHSFDPHEKTSGQWKHLQIPLDSFTEHGSWDNEWFDPQGIFDWSAVDRFEIVSEHHDLKNKQFWFDAIRIVNPSLSQVYRNQYKKIALWILRLGKFLQAPFLLPWAAGDEK